MSDVTKIRLPDNSELNIKDYRIPGVDTAPTSGSDNVVTSGGVYQAINDDALVTSAAINNLNDRLSDVESAIPGIDEVPTENSENLVTSGGVYDVIAENELATASALNDLRDRIGTIGDDYVITEPFDDIEGTVRDTYTKQEVDDLFSAYEPQITETDPVFVASPAHEITTSDITNWNSKTSNTGTLTGVSFNGTNATVSNGVASITATIPDAVTESTVSGWGFTKNTGTLIAHAKHKLTTTNGTATSASGTITYVESLTGTTTATDGDLTLTATRKSVTIPAAQVQSDWNATTGMGVILNKPTIPEVTVRIGQNANLGCATDAPSGLFGIATIEGNDGLNYALGLGNSDGSEDCIIATTDQLTPSSEKFYFVQGSSSAAGSSTSGSYLSVKWEGTIPGVSAVYNGLKIAYRIATRTGIASGGVVLSIDGTNYYPVVIQANTMVTTHYPVGATVLMVFNSTQTATAYLTAGTKSTVTGCWQIMEYNTNTTYALLTAADMQDGTATAQKTISAERLKQAVEYWDAIKEVQVNGTALTPDANKAVNIVVPSEVTEQTISGWGFTKNTGTLTTEIDPVFSASVAAGITSSDITNWNSKTSNTGTVTGVKMNGITNNPTSGVVDLGTVLTSETSLSKGTTTGSGNAVTDISVSGHQITLTKGSTFLTSETSLSKGTTTGSGNAVTDISVSGHQITLTKGTTFLTSHQDISGKANLSGAAFTGTVTGTSSGNTAQFRNITISSSEPTASDGSNGDIWIVI